MEGKYGFYFKEVIHIDSQWKIQKKGVKRHFIIIKTANRFLNLKFKTDCYKSWMIQLK